ncbi:hypothetical protein AB0I60_19210 [Actinosynnema sp. NPDC050436]|uniref:hypothetical protein n=1 Tax=Actinosynnema sp. NPDC050436 TaxID=3155659 RepID=UPI0033DCC2DD
MPFRRRPHRSAILLPIALAVTCATAARPGPGEPPPAAPAPASGDREVTLVTGDRVTVSPDGTRARVTGAPGREGVRFTTSRVGDRLEVVPEDVRDDLAAGRLDRRLFDVRGLLGAGVRDARRASLPARREPAPPAGTHRLTVRHLGPDGRPADRAETRLFGLDADVDRYARGPESSLDLPPGRYTLVGDVVEADGDWHRIVQPTLELTGDTTVVVDARTTRPVTTTVERPDARPAWVDLGFERRYGEGEVFSTSLTSVPLGKLHTAHLGPRVTPEEMTSGLSSAWGVPGPHGDFRNTPYTYNLLDTEQGGFFTGFHRDVRDAELATQTAWHHGQVPGRQATKGWYGLATGYAAISGTLLPYDLPARVTHLLDTRDTQWSGSFGEQVEQGGVMVYATAMGSDYRAYRAGTRYEDRWNQAVFGPFLFRPDHARRTGDRIWFGSPLYTDQRDHRAGSRTDRASVRLFQDGREVGRSSGGQAQATVRPGPSRLRVENTSERSSMFRLSTRVDTTWTFRSDTVADAALPLWVVRYFPEVDQDNRVSAGRVLELPVEVSAQPGAAVGTPGTPKVGASWDGGRTWHPVEVRQRTATASTALVPVQGARLSLRAEFADSHGNAVDQRIVDALRFDDGADAPGNTVPGDRPTPSACITTPSTPVRDGLRVWSEARNNCATPLTFWLLRHEADGSAWHSSTEQVIPPGGSARLDVPCAGTGTYSAVMFDPNMAFNRSSPRVTIAC